MDELVIPAVIITGTLATNRVVEHMVKPVLQDVFEGNQKLPRSVYSILMTIAAILVGMVTYWQTPGIAEAFDSTLFSLTPSLPVMSKFIFAGIALWLGADFIRPVFALLTLVNSSIEKTREIANAVKSSGYPYPAPVAVPIEAQTVKVSAADQVISKKGQG